MTNDQNAKILIVDDEISNVELLEGMLTREGYTTYRSLTDPRLVVPTYKEWQPDLILLDIMMPYMDGFAVMEALKDIVPTDDFLPILVLTADMSIQTKKRTLSSGAMDFVTKPFDIVEVILRIRNLLHARALHKGLQNQNIFLEEKVLERTAELREINERFNRLVSDLNDVVWTASKDGSQLLDLSDTFEKVYGIPKQALKTNPSLWLEMVHPDDRTIAERSANELFKNGKADAEYRIVRPDGTIRWIHDRKSLIKDEHGNPIQMGGLARDITERKSIEQQLLRAQRMESVGTLAGGIAHDLNNILAPIMMALQILRKRSTDPNDNKLIDMLETQTKRGADLVKQVLTFARGSDAERTPIQSRHLINELKKFVQETFPANIFVETDVTKDLWTIMGDPTQIHQVLLNLCINARDAMPLGGTLTIDAENVSLDEHYARMNIEAKPGPYCVITVKDAGVGMPPEIQHKIFEPFFTTKETGKGTGLGLSTVYSLVKGHGGFINVYSEVGNGTQFKIYLPATESTETNQTQAEAKKLSLGSGELILFVDDEAAVRYISKVSLEANGYQVLTANGGTEAISLYAQRGQEIRLVITDMSMPFMDGPSLVRALRKMNPNIRIIGASGLADKVKLADAQELGMNAFLSKPYTAEKILQSIATVLKEPT